MTARDILLLGNPLLYEKSEKVKESEIHNIDHIVADLNDTLISFRNDYGVGRAIAAPQIGEQKRIIYMYIDEPIVFVNPTLKNLSTDMIDIWDDCMCFPNLLVHVRRHRTCTIEYRDENWEMQSLDLQNDLSELLQHEYDHLEGILAVSRAIDGKSFALRSQKHLLQSL